MHIRTYGDPVLRRIARPVKEIGDETRRLCERMVEAMIRARGIGLAAPQVGVSHRIFVLDVDGEFHVMINPEVVERSNETSETPEGCLSVPGVDAPIARPARIVVEGTSLDGDRVRIEGEGLLARAIEHEIDHLDGRLFLDHLSPARRRSLLKEYVRQRDDEADETA